MSKKFPEHKGLNLSAVNKEVQADWEAKDTFQKSLDSRKGKPAFVFYEGPPSANGKPGIHHVMARTIKDIFCRYKTQQGYYVGRKAGWDTHGLPVELGVEKSLGITKEDIGKTITVAEYNQKCREDVMTYTDLWEDLTKQMGYWVNMDDPYITYDNRYIETLWYLLKELYKKGLLYKGKTIQPFSPAAGTGLSSHELNQPGCYRDVKDTTAVAQFKVVENETSAFLFEGSDTPVYFLAWTTTPWTLPSNTALAVGPKIDYVKIRTFNQYTFEPITIVMAKPLQGTLFSEKNAELALEDYKPGDKKIPFKVLAEFKGADLEGIRYEQLLPYHQPTDGDAFRVVLGNFVTTEDGTGIVHIAPSFGADDALVGKQNGIGSLTLVDNQGRFIDGMEEFSGRFVKNEYDPELTADDPTVDVELVIKLKKENKAFKVAKYEHSYPHCWRTDKPILYYPLDSWFIRTTAAKERMVELNKTINWQPASTGEGRFGQWLENLVDWNLSRSRYWGTPLPIWRTEDGEEEICIGSVAEMKAEIEKAVSAGLMESNPLADWKEGDNSKENYDIFDLHRPNVDEVVLVSASGKPMRRETDLIDVWFDSGAMPYAQLHYPFENKDHFDRNFPADFIAEGVDQTRGWFFTLHALATMLFDSVAFKNIVSNGLVLAKDGQKMSKRLNNAINPFDLIGEQGSDPVRWYMVTNADPWDNIKFDPAGVDEVKRKFFGTLYNTYSFFSLYANIDGFTNSEDQIPLEERPEIDRWIISLLNSLVKDVTKMYDTYEPKKAGRLIQDFVNDNLSNWYVRLNRKRFWGGEYDNDKIAAYQTLYTCLKTISQLIAPIAPFYSERLYTDLLTGVGETSDSVHIDAFPSFDESAIDADLEARMELAQKISSMVLALRRKVNIKVRQPLQKILLPILDQTFKTRVEKVEDIIKTEVNIKEIEYITDTTGVISKKIKPNFKVLGKKLGKLMRFASAEIGKMSQDDIAQMERDGQFEFQLDGQATMLTLAEVEITSEDIPGYQVATEGQITLALDVTITEELRSEGIAREFINRIQNLRKDNGFEVTDKVNIKIQKHEAIDSAIEAHSEYIGQQTLAAVVELVDSLAENANAKSVDLGEEILTYISISKN